MGAYLLRRLALLVPTLFGIILINFVVIQFAPGGPVEQLLAELRSGGGGTMGRLTGEGNVEGRAPSSSNQDSGSSGYRGARGLDPAIVREIERSFSQLLARGKYVHSMVFHDVKPDKVDEYVDLVGGWYPKVAQNSENKVNLVGSWRTEVGDCDTFGKQWSVQR